MKKAFDFIRRNKAIRNIALLLLEICIISFILLWLVDRVIMPAVVHRGKTCVVPNLIDLSLTEVDSILGRTGLNLQLWAEEYDPTKPPGTILAQIPPPNTKVKEGRMIKVTVSKGEEMVLVPKVRGLSLRQAELLLAHIGLQLGDIEWIPSDSFPEDVVIVSTPSSGVSVPAGISVNLQVSLGISPDTVIVPDMVGMNLEESKEVLLERGLQLGDLKFKVNNDYPEGTVLKQTPQAGEKIERGSKIDLEVSTTE